METQVADAKPAPKLAPFTTPVMTPAGCATPTTSVRETDTGLPDAPAAAICTLPV